MLDKVAHALVPVGVIIAATFLLATGKIDSATGVAMITGAGGVGVVTVAKAGGS